MDNHMQFMVRRLRRATTTTLSSRHWSSLANGSSQQSLHHLWPRYTVVRSYLGAGCRKAVAVLLDSKEPWEQYTYLSGDQLSWNELFALVKRWDPQWTSQTKPLAASIRQIADNVSLESAYVGYFEIQSYAGALTLPKEKVQRQRAKYFPQVHFRTIEEILATAARQPDTIV